MMIAARSGEYFVWMSVKLAFIRATNCNGNRKGSEIV